MTDNFSMNDYIQNLDKVFRSNANQDNAEPMKKYKRNKFEFFGLKAQERRKLSRKFMRKANRPDYDQLKTVIKELWNLSEREFQYFGCELLERYEKEFTKDIIELFEYIITNKSWWDTIDRIAKKLVGVYFEKFPDKRDEYIKNWVQSDNIWLQRTILLFQLAYKEKTDVELLFGVIEKLKDIDEFFIQKAIGWALREYSRTDPEIVEDFIVNNDLSALSEREGMKIIRKK